MSVTSRRPVPAWVVRVFSRLPNCFLTRTVQVLLDGFAAAAALTLALALRFDFNTGRWAPNFALWIPTLAAIRPCLLLLTRGYRCTWRHFHLRDSISLFAKSAILTLILLVLRLASAVGLRLHVLPLSVILIELNLFFLLAASPRVLRRLTYTTSMPSENYAYRTILVADECSIGGAVRLMDPYADVHLIGIVSDEEQMQRCTIAGIPVLGRTADIGALIISKRIELILMSGSNFHSVEQIIATVGPYGVQVRIIPTPHDLLTDQVRVSRSLHLEQIMRSRGYFARSAHPDVNICLKGRRVLVTGAAGSIGSEICRQVANLPLSSLILLDQDENATFELVNELADARVDTVSCVGDIRDSEMLERIFETYSPDVVFHAAAYKHVPLMESNPCEAILNNVRGTRELVEAAEKFRCERFVMISTDKAVRPSSIMGATKRIAEMIVQHRAMISSTSPGTQFACVRFGNVVGSRGSVVPLFLDQIERGGPVTITHPEMTRYFMSIPQAVQLVLEAMTLASNGEVYMLDMGDPVKIIDFARDLIRMSGLQPDVDIPIKIVGIRPGEKLHEQLWREDAEVYPTIFSSVYRVQMRPVPESCLGAIARLERAAVERQEEGVIRELLSELPIDFLSEQPHRDNSAGVTAARTQVAAAGAD